MTTKDIQTLLAKKQVLMYHSPVIENIQPFFRYEYDVLSISKSGMICEFEVKISRSDFLKIKEVQKQIIYGLPQRKDGRTFHDCLGWTDVPNYFSYCCPEGLIDPIEIPAFSGLYYCNGDNIWEVKKPKQIHKHTFKTDRIFKKIMRYYSERNYLGGCRLTYENKKLINSANR